MRSRAKHLPIMWRRMISGAGVAILAVALQACAIDIDRPDVVIGTGSPGGSYYPLGGSICRLFNLDLARTGRRCAVLPSGGSVENIASLADGRIDIGIVQSDVLADAIAGKGPFASRGPASDLRVLFTGHADAFTIVARRELGIRAVTGLRGKRINMGAPGTGERASMERIMTALDVTRDVFSKTLELSLAEQHRALCDNRLDAIVYSVAHPNGLIQDAIRSCHGVLVDLSSPAIDAMMSRHPEYERSVIPGGTYVDNPDDVRTLGVRAVVVTRGDFPDSLAYAVTKAVFENFDAFRILHPSFARLSVTDMVGVSVRTPFHPGAVQYFIERGWMRRP